MRMMVNIAVLEHRSIGVASINQATQKVQYETRNPIYQNINWNIYLNQENLINNIRSVTFDT